MTHTPHRYPITSHSIKIVTHISHRYHHDTFFAQRAGVLVRRVDPMQFTDYLELMFANQESECIMFSWQDFPRHCDKFGDFVVKRSKRLHNYCYIICPGFLSGAVNMTEPEVQDKMATLASTKLTISKDMYVCPTHVKCTQYTCIGVTEPAYMIYKQEHIKRRSV